MNQDTTQQELRDKILELDYQFQSTSSGGYFRVNGIPSKKTKTALAEIVNSEVRACLERLQNTGRSEDEFRGAIEAELKKYGGDK